VSFLKPHRDFGVSARLISCNYLMRNQSRWYPTLAKFLEDPIFKKSEVNIGGDVEKIFRDRGISVRSVFDIRQLAKCKGYHIHVWVHRPMYLRFPPSIDERIKKMEDSPIFLADSAFSPLVSTWRIYICTRIRWRGSSLSTSPPSTYLGNRACWSWGVFRAEPEE
jgi:hypothetical protein